MCQIVFVRVADDERHAGEVGNFLRGALGIAAGNYYLAFGIFPADSANRGTSVLFSGSRYSTGIKHHEPRPVGVVGLVDSELPKLLLNRGSIGLCCAATEIFYVKAGHGTILAYVQLRSWDPELLQSHSRN